ncbi:MAG TPA: phage holin family protein [Marmoricola sp.]|nr:phage holin family protein [Marmoricola sp.]
MSEPDPRSLIELLAALARDIPDLVHKEVALARTEARRALDLLLIALRRLALGSVIAVGAVGLALAALVSALSALLIARGIEPSMASLISTSAVTVVAGSAALLLFASARRSLEAARSSLDDSMRTLAETFPDQHRGEHADRQSK